MRAKTDPAVIWQISDGKRGHLSQSSGLIKALRRCVPLTVYQVTAPPLIRSLVSCVTRNTGWARDLPAPQVVIGAGHATHAAILAVRRTYRARVVVLMRPSLPLGWFDYCLVPAHDDPPGRDGVIVTMGAVNPMQAGQDHDPGRGLILVGGPSRHYRLDDTALLARIRQVLAHTTDRHWTLSNSPRTPPHLTRELTGLAASGVDVVLWDRCEQDWLADQLARSSDVWISEDSISMIYEALTAGCRVGLLPLPRKSASRLHRAIDQLLREGFVCAYNDWLEGSVLAAPPRPLDEANRCARLLLDKGLLSATTG